MTKSSRRQLVSNWWESSFKAAKEDLQEALEKVTVKGKGDFPAAGDAILGRKLSEAWNIFEETFQ